MEFDPQNPHAQQTLRILAEAAARAGGSVARQYFRTEYDVRIKDDRSEVSDADEAAQAAVVDCIRAARPADAFITEETQQIDGAAQPSDDGLCWIIDPIDGTRNFVRHIPLYVSSVAAMIDGYPLVGAVYDGQRDVLYSASRIGGLFVNGQHLPPRRESPSQARGLNPRPLVGIPSTPTEIARPLTTRWLERYVCRNLGTTALHMALIAAGELDAMVADNPRLWDIAAGWVLITASGGRVHGLDESPLFPLDVASYDRGHLPMLAFSATASNVEA